jgi:hypothetical protein
MSGLWCAKKDQSGFVYEPECQLAFHLAANTVLPEGNLMSANIGPLTDTNDQPKYLDFYIDSPLEWGIDITTDGRNVEELLSRFANNGKYDVLHKVRIFCRNTS